MGDGSLRCRDSGISSSVSRGQAFGGLARARARLRAPGSLDRRGGVHRLDRVARTVTSRGGRRPIRRSAPSARRPGAGRKRRGRGAPPPPRRASPASWSGYRSSRGCRSLPGRASRTRSTASANGASSVTATVEFHVPTPGRTGVNSERPDGIEAARCPVNSTHNIPRWVSVPRGCCAGFTPPGGPAGPGDG